MCNSLKKILQKIRIISNFEYKQIFILIIFKRHQLGALFFINYYGFTSLKSAVNVTCGA